ncbi:hypothetical protein BDV95DRAFT_589667 [Massariosphaeria phaeospora]|uniref:Uncharacterized protein n=1 Tax=Massariosphaeria phaeospora TaxID=100035 RepID=A0A7C8MJF0_9PLEO|nr:hypothetical protein BDV95DRAFT_589667 [Massariosphaeria phaeospora]
MRFTAALALFAAVATAVPAIQRRAPDCARATIGGDTSKGSTNIQGDSIDTLNCQKLDAAYTQIDVFNEGCIECRVFGGTNCGSMPIAKFVAGSTPRVFDVPEGDKMIQC